MLKSFKILEKIKILFKFDLSNKMNIHSVFHISLLRKNLNDSHFDQMIFSSLSIIIDEERKYDVKNIIDFKLIKRRNNK
jgi:hypothetical protein